MVSKRLLSLSFSLSLPFPLSLSPPFSLFFSLSLYSLFRGLRFHRNREWKWRTPCSLRSSLKKNVCTHSRAHSFYTYIYMYRCTCENNDTSATLGDYFKVNLLRSSTTHFALNSFISSCAWWKFSARSTKLKKKKEKNTRKSKNTYSESKNWLRVELACHLVMFVV